MVRRAAELLAAAGANVLDVPPPFTDDPYPALDRVFQVRARAEWEAFREEQRAQVLPQLVTWSAGADRLSATDLERSTAAVARARNHLSDALAGFDLVLAPVLPVISFAAELIGLEPERPLAHCTYTCWFNQTGQPAASVCLGMEDGMPVGVQLIGRRFADRDVLAAAAWLEARRGFSPEWPLTPRPTAQPPLVPA